MLLLVAVAAVVAAVAVLRAPNRDPAPPREETLRWKGEPDPLPVAPRLLEVVRRLPWSGRKEFTTEFSHDSRLCMAFGRDAFRVWDVETGKVVLEVAGQSRIDSICFFPDDKELLSSHKDGVFRRWDLATGKQLSQFQGPVGGGCIMGRGRPGTASASATSRGRSSGT